LSCEWHLKGEAITAKVAKSDLQKLVGESTTERILFLTSRRLVIQDEDETMELHRCILPDSLPRR
jgi:GTP cyclohydrolase I